MAELSSTAAHPKKTIKATRRTGYSPVPGRAVGAPTLSAAKAHVNGQDDAALAGMMPQGHFFPVN